MPAYYFLIPKNHPRYEEVLNLATSTHSQSTGGRATAGVYKGILAEDLVKVAGGDQAWFRTLPQRNLMTFIGAQGDPTADDARYAWEGNNVRNHTLPTIPTRGDKDD